MLRITDKRVVLSQGDVVVEVMREDFELFCRQFVRHNRYRSQRFGQAFYDKFGLNRLPPCEQLVNIYNAGSRRARRLIAELGLPSEHLK